MRCEGQLGGFKIPDKITPTYQMKHIAVNPWVILTSCYLKASEVNTVHINIFAPYIFSHKLCFLI